MSAFADMIARYALPGSVAGLLVRKERLASCAAIPRVEVTEAGLAGDHARPGKRAVTLIQQEHLAVIGAVLGQGQVDPALLRRNIVVAGINLNALKGRALCLGGCVLRITGICAPCSRMESALGKGGYSAMRGHGGWCAEVVTSGAVGVGDAVTPLPMD